MTHCYQLPDPIDFEPLIGPISKAEDAAARLDERLRRTPLAEGFSARLAYGEACANRLADGDLVHLEDLVLFDAGAYSGPVSPALSSALHTLQYWRRAHQTPAIALLHADCPGELPADQHGLLHHAPDADPGTLAAWRAVLHQSRSFPPVLAAAIAWDAWLLLEPDPSGAWRAPLLAALVLKAREKTQRLLLPIDTGRRFAKYRRHPAHDFHDRMAGFLQWIETAAIRASKDFDSLVLAEALLRPTLARQRRHSRLPGLVSLLLSRPLISAPMAARVLGVSQVAVLRMLAKLAPIPREFSGRTRYRVWGIL